MTRLDEIAARLAAATPGPWVVDRVSGFNSLIRVAEGRPNEYEIIVGSQGMAGYGHDVHNAALIAHAPADLAYLLEHARQAEAVIAAALAEAARLRAALAWYAYEADAVMMYDDSGARATAALTAPAPNAERGQALLDAETEAVRLRVALERIKNRSRTAELYAWLEERRNAGDDLDEADWVSMVVCEALAA